MEYHYFFGAFGVLLGCVVNNLKGEFDHLVVFVVVTLKSRRLRVVRRESIVDSGTASQYVLPMTFGGVEGHDHCLG